ncbi:MAG: sulfotransferase [Fulvivirga sp.]
MYNIPDFLIIGAGKSGTTSLDNYLKQHPDIFMSSRKEPDFFSYDKIDLRTLDKDALAHYENAVTDIKTYSDLFQEASEHQLKGETSNTYLVIEGTAENIYSYHPQMKLIAILRQPTQRLFSRYLHLARESELPSKNFEEVLDKSSIWWIRNDLVKEGFYYKNLKRYFDVFPHQNIRVYLQEDLKNHPVKTLNSIYEFLSLKKLDAINDTIEYNKSGFIKNKFYDRTIGHNSIIKKVIKKVIPSTFYKSLKENKWLKQNINKLQEKNLERPQLSKALYQKITDDIYKEDIVSLSKLIKRDLNSWL